MPKNRFIFLIATGLLFASCVGRFGGGVKAESITEISESAHTGLGNSSFEITLRKDGTAEFTCTFYNVTKDPEPDSMQVRMVEACGTLYKNNRSEFRPEGSGGYSSNSYTLKGTFKGSIPAEEFNRIAKLVVDNGFFSLDDKYMEPGLMDAPPIHTKVVHASGQKEILNQAGKAGAKLNEIEQAIRTQMSSIIFEP